MQLPGGQVDVHPYIEGQLNGTQRSEPPHLRVLPVPVVERLVRVLHRRTDHLQREEGQSAERFQGGDHFRQRAQGVTEFQVGDVAVGEAESLEKEKKF